MGKFQNVPRTMIVFNPRNVAMDFVETTGYPSPSLNWSYRLIVNLVFGLKPLPFAT